MHIIDLPTTQPDWFALGFAVFEGRAAYLDRYPPLNDMQAQRGWLGGFGPSWIEAAERHDRDPARYPPTLDLWTHLTRAHTAAPHRPSPS